MEKQAANINKILEIDIDTNREIVLQMRQIAAVHYDRERQPDPSVDITDDLVILANALGACILKAEQDGIFKPGQAMKRAIEYLNEIYVDTSCQITNALIAASGNVIYRDINLKP